MLGSKNGKEMTITLTDDGRDLTFKIKKMSATQLESWILRASILLSKGGANIDISNIAGIKDLVMSGTVLKVLSGINYNEAAPLLEELLECCSRELKGGGTMQCSSDTVDGYIEDVQTLFRLKLEAAQYNFGFFTEMAAEKLSDSQPSKVVKISKTNKEN